MLHIPICAIRPLIAHVPLSGVCGWNPIYAYSLYSNAEKIDIATGKLSNPYPVQWDTLKGVPWEGRMTCGHNPWLFARKVDNLRVEKDDVGVEKVLWDERPKPVPD